MFVRVLVLIWCNPKWDWHELLCKAKPFQDKQCSGSLLLFLTGAIMSAGPATLRILIKGGKVVNDDFTQEADVYIENGIIQQVGKELMIPGGAKVIDATGKLVLPGGIDTSVHLQESFMNVTTADDFYSGTKVPCVQLVPCIYVQLCNNGMTHNEVWNGDQ